MITVIVDPIGLGRFRASLGDRVLCESRTPLLGAARVLLAEGVDPATPLAMRHRTSDTIAMRSTVGAAARLSVDEYGPRFVPYREMTVEAITEARLWGGPGQARNGRQWRSHSRLRGHRGGAGSNLWGNSRPETARVSSRVFGISK
jgi:hypothetical protein